VILRPCSPRLTSQLRLEQLEDRTLLNAGALDPSFGIGGKLTTHFGGFDNCRALAIQPDGRILVVGYVAVNGTLDFGLARYNADGSLDTSFGAGGEVITDVGGNGDPDGIVVLPSGKILVAGQGSNGGSTSESTLVQYTASGNLDTSFGTGGEVFTKFTAGNDFATGLAVQADGKLVVAGDANYQGPNGHADCALARYNADGGLDNTFGTGGQIIVALTDHIHGIAIQADGRIVVAGDKYSGASWDFALARFNGDGSLDGTFGTGGLATTDFNGGYDSARSLAIQPDGRIVAVGYGTSNPAIGSGFGLARYNTDGSLDTTFGAGGKVTTNFFGFNGDAASGVAILSNGKLVAGGSVFSGTSPSASDFGLARYNPNGSLDTTFGTGGKVSTDLGGNDWIAGIAIQGNGGIVAAGEANYDTEGDFALACYTPYGISEFSLPSPHTQPDWIHAGPDGNVWWSEGGSSSLGRIGPAGVITEIPTPFPVGDFTFGPDGNLWLSGNTDIAEMSQQGALLHDYSINQITGGNPGGGGIAFGPDGNVWFTEGYSRDVIGQISPDGTITEFPIPGDAFGPNGAQEIINGPDGNLWFDATGVNTIGSITPTGDFTLFANLTTVPGGIRGLTLGPDGNFWWTHQDTIFEMNTAGQVLASYPDSNGPYLTTVGPDGNIWFTESGNQSSAAGGGPNIGSITPQGTITEYPIPTANSGPATIAAGSDGNIWFTEYAANQIGEVVLKTATTETLGSSVNPSVFGQQVTFTAAVSAGTAAAGETVTFMDGSSTLGTGTLDSSGQATLTTSTLAVGSHTITAVYNGDASFQSSSASMTHTVSQDATSITLAVTPAAAPHIVEYPVPTPNSSPDSAVSGPDGNVWFLERTTNSLGRITAAGQITEVPIPSPLQPGTMLFGPEGNIWIGGHSIIGEMTPQGALLHAYTIQSALGSPYSWNTMPIAFGSDGNIWYTNGYANDVVGRLTPADGTTTEFSLGFGGGPIVSGPDGNIWVGGNGTETLSRVHLDGTIDTFQLPSPSAASGDAPRGLIVGPDGNLWMTDAAQTPGGTDLILRVNTSGQITGQFNVPTPNADAYGMTVGSDGALWFGEINANQIGRITVNGVLTEYPIPTPNSGSGVPTSGPDGNIWFTEYYANQIGELVLYHGASVYGQPVTYTASVSANVPGSGVPAAGEPVTFLDRAMTLGTGTLNSSGQATLTSSSLAVGSHTITALYSGDANFVSSSASLAQTVSEDTTTTTLAVTPSAALKIVEYHVPTPNSGPDWTVSGPDGNLWFSEVNAPRIGKITPQGSVSEIALPISPDQIVGQIVSGPNGNLWFSIATVNATDGTPSGAGEILEMTPAGTVVQEFTLPTVDDALCLTQGPDGNIWFADYYRGMIGRMTPAGAVTYFQAPYGIAGIIAGPDGNLWFEGTSLPSIGRVAPDGTITVFPLPSGGRGLTAGPDGNLWMCAGDNEIYRISTAGQLTGNFIIPTPNSGDYGMAAGSDGALWFNEGAANQIGRITVAGVITEYPIPTSNSGSEPIASGPDGNIWFAEYYSNQIGELVLNHGASVYGQPVTYTASVSGNVPGSGVPAAGETVSFIDGNTMLGTGILNSSGQATLTTSSLAVGSHTITAFYSGDANLLSSSASLTQTVSQDATTTTLTVGAASTPLTNEFPLPVPNSLPNALTLGPDGNVWFTEDGNNHTLAYITPTGQVTQVPTPLPAGSFAFGPDGNIWFSAGGTAIAEMTPAGVLLHDYPIPSTANPVQPIAGPNINLTFGPDGNIWYVEPYTSDLVGRITPTGQIAEWALPFSFSGAAEIVTGPDGKIWFDATGDNTIGSINPADATIDSYNLPVANPGGGAGGNAVRGLTFDAQGNLWMAEQNSTQPRFFEFSISTDQTTVIPDPVPGSNPYGMSLGADGSLWFTDDHNDHIGRISIATDGTATVTEYPIAIPQAVNGTITTGGGGTIWFGGSSSNTIGEVVINQGSSVYAQPVTFTATVSANALGAGRPTGTVTFYNGSAVLGTATLPAKGPDQVSLTTTFLPVGSNVITAVYSGDTNFLTSNGSGTQTVTPATLTVTANYASILYGRNVPPLTYNITGFVNGDTPSVVSGTASLTTPATETSDAGNYPIVAAQGNLSAANYTFAFVNGTLTISQDPTLTLLSASPSPSSFGQPVTLTVTVATNPSSSITPIGTVDFYDTTTQADLGRVSLSNSTASLTTTSLEAGANLITASYSGGTDFIPSTGSVSQTVNPVVIDTNDSGPGSLRQAIIQANAAGVRETIIFNIPSSDPGYSPATGVFTIRPFSALPAITSPVVIDGYSQPGALQNTLALGENAVLKIVLDGSLAGITDGLDILSGNGTIVRGLVINHFEEAGIQVSGVTNNGQWDSIAGNFIGTDATGLQSAPNGSFGVGIADTTHTIIGGAALQQRNIISGGGRDGIGMGGIYSEGNLVEENWIGLDANGNPLGNLLSGVYLDAGRGELVESNVIGGNQGPGVLLRDGTTQDTIVNNSIGTDGTGLKPLPNAEGIVLDTASNGNEMFDNVIAFNSGDGIAVEGNGTVDNAIAYGSFYGNGGLGIDLVNGGNNSQAAPTILDAHLDAPGTTGNLVVTFQTNSPPTSSTYPLYVDFYRADATGQGKTDLGTVTFTQADYSAGFKTAALGNASTLGLSVAGDSIVATVRDSAGNTSEFCSAGPIRGYATQFLVTASPVAISGLPFNMVVTAQDAYGNTATGYTGTVTFTSSDSQATLPSPYTFTTADAGVHTFSATVIKTTNNAFVEAGDSVSGIRGDALMMVKPARFLVAGFPSPTTAGVAHSFTVTALNADGTRAMGYFGTVTFSSTDGQAARPAPYTFTAADAGTHTFSATLKTAGPQALTATDSAAFGVVGTQSQITVLPAVAKKLLVAGFPSPTIAGVAHTFTVTAIDQFGNTATNYTGTVRFASNDAKATALPNYTFTAADAGVHPFNFTFMTAGTRSLTATDTTTASITGSQTGILVQGAAASSFTVAGFPSPATAGVPGTFTVTAKDTFGNIATGYGGTVTFSSNDPQAVFPTNSYTFVPADAGVHSFTATLKTAGTQSIAATDVAKSSLTGTQKVSVKAAAAVQFLVSAPASATAGTAFSVTVIAQDSYGNTATSYSGTISFTSSDTNSKVVLPASYTFIPGTDNGKHTFTKAVTLVTAGSQSITVTDSVTSSITGTAVVSVKAGAATHLVISAPQNVTHGVPFTITVTILDLYGNVAVGYLGTIHFSSTDSTAALPSNYTFTGTNAGVHTFTVTMNTPGYYLGITATDIHNSTITGSSSAILVTEASLDQLFGDSAIDPEDPDGMPDFFDSGSGGAGPTSHLAELLASVVVDQLVPGRLQAVENDATDCPRADTSQALSIIFAEWQKESRSIPQAEPAAAILAAGLLGYGMLMLDPCKRKTRGSAGAGNPPISPRRSWPR
jgi:uncharacterized delta-60 repeat protein